MVGGMAPQKQQRLLRQRPEIVVATPGRLWELMSTWVGPLSFFTYDCSCLQCQMKTYRKNIFIPRRCHGSLMVSATSCHQCQSPLVMCQLVASQNEEHLSDLKRLRFLVLDEADRMVAQGHFQELTSILDFIKYSR